MNEKPFLSAGATSALVIACATHIATAQNWINPAGGDWNTGANWSGGAVPTGNSIIGATAPATGTFTVSTSAAPPDITQLQLQARNGQTVTLNINHSLTSNSGNTKLNLSGQSGTAVNVLNLNAGTLTLTNAGGDAVNMGTGQNTINIQGGSISTDRHFRIGHSGTAGSVNVVNQTSGTYTSSHETMLGSAVNTDAASLVEWNISGGSIIGTFVGGNSFVVGRAHQKASFNVSGSADVNIAGLLSVVGDQTNTTMVDQSMSVSGGSVNAGAIRIGNAGGSGAFRNASLTLSGGTMRSSGSGATANDNGSFTADSGDGTNRTTNIAFSGGTLEARTFNVNLTGTDRMDVGDGNTATTATLKFINTATAASTFTDGIRVRTDGRLATSAFQHTISTTTNGILVQGGLRIGDANTSTAGALPSGVGTLVVNGPGVAFDSTAVLTLDITSLASFDRLTLGTGSKDLIYGGSVMFNLLEGFSLDDGDTFQVFSGFTTQSGDFASITGGNYNWDFNPSTGTFTAVSPIPEPSAAALGVLGACCMILRRRRIGGR